MNHLKFSIELTSECMEHNKKKRRKGPGVAVSAI